MNRDDILQRLLEGRLRDPDSGTSVRVAIRAIAIENTLIGQEQFLLSQLGFGHKLLLVADPDSFAALGERVRDALSAFFQLELHMLPRRPKADFKTAIEIRDRLQSFHAAIAVGGGTIGDLCKYASAQSGKPYAIFATAPSMNGYCSANVALLVDGLKRSLPAIEPAAVFIDLEVWAAAPLTLIQAGVGDSLCRSTVQADWLLAHFLLDRPYRRLPFEMMQADENLLIQSMDNLSKGDLTAMRALARLLVLSGLSMTICGSSHPASQGEHLISHYLEMMPGMMPEPRLHGEQIAVTTLTMAKLQERILQDPPPRLHATRLTEDDFRAHYGAQLGSLCWSEFMGKYLTPSDASALTTKLERNWPEIREAIQAEMRPYDEIYRALSGIGAPTSVEALKLDPLRYREAVVHARELRDRFGFLDLAAESDNMALAFA